MKNGPICLWKIGNEPENISARPGFRAGVFHSLQAGESELKD